MPYQPPVDRFILNLKFYEPLTYAAVLGETMADYLSRYTLTDIDYLLPVPLSAQRFKQRGFNQALEIARPIARALQLPLGDQLVKRLRHTPAQSDLPAKDRSKNIRNAFAADPRLAGKSVVIIDDVMTTGSTLRSLCAALSAVGVARIEVWCCARALKV